MCSADLAAPQRRPHEGESHGESQQNKTPLRLGLTQPLFICSLLTYLMVVFYKYRNKYHWHFSMLTLSLRRINVPLDMNERFGCESAGDIHGSAPGWWDSVLWARQCVKHIRSSTGLRGVERAWLCLHGAAKSSEGGVRPEYSSPSLLMLTQRHR